MSSNSLPFVDKLNEFFYEGLNRQSSACLYGSAATRNWVPSRSDLDLIIAVPNKTLNILGHKIRDWAWSSTPRYPILDGYALSLSKNGFSITRLDDFLKVTYPSPIAQIDLVDQWIIKNRSKHLFGNESITSLFPDISHSQLSAWAIERLDYIARSNPEFRVPETNGTLSGIIWSISWLARMLMLSRGSICESKREALHWLANEYSEIKDLVRLLLDDYSKSDNAPSSITSEQSAILRRFCLGLLLREDVKVDLV